MTLVTNVTTIRFVGYTTAERDEISPIVRERLLILNTETKQFELYLDGEWRGILRLNADGAITPTHHGVFIGDDLHNEYARVQAPEDISGGWHLRSGGSIRGGWGDEPEGEIVFGVKTTTGAPTHSASAGVPCWVMPDYDLYINKDGGTNWVKQINMAAAELITGLHNFKASGLGGLTDYDITIGDVAAPSYGIARIGNSLVGRTSYKVAGMDLDGAVILRNIGGPVTGQIEFAMLESGGQAIRFALPKSGVGNATYSPRSMLIAGPAVLDDDIVTVGYWQGQGIFHNLACDTSGDGADLGVQNDLEVEGDIFADSFKESTPGAGLSFVNDIQGSFVKMLNVGAAMVQATAPATPANGQIWLDTAASGTGGLGVLNVTTITSNATLTTSQTVVLCDASSGAITVTLPAASGNDGRHYHIKKIDSSPNIVTVDGNGSETIDGETTQAIAVQYNSIQIVCDGSAWHIL